MADIVPIEQIDSKIYFIRGVKVMLDRNLAELYGWCKNNCVKSKTD